MKIQEAINSKKPFKRKKEGNQFWSIILVNSIVAEDSHKDLSLKVNDILADDWEIKQ